MHVHKTIFPILGFAAYSGTGKTTLLKQLIPLLKAKGLRLGMIKHAHHDFDVDIPGKDSYELRKAGADQMLIASGKRWALMVEDEKEGDPDLWEMLEQLNTCQLDLVLVEGFKRVPFPKIELHRPETGRPLLYREDDNIIAFATNGPSPDAIMIPVLNLDDVGAIADFVLEYARTQTNED